MSTAIFILVWRPLPCWVTALWFADSLRYEPFGQGHWPLLGGGKTSGHKRVLGMQQMEQWWVGSPAAWAQQKCLPGHKADSLWETCPYRHFLCMTWLSLPRARGSLFPSICHLLKVSIWYSLFLGHSFSLCLIFGRCFLFGNWFSVRASATRPSRDLWTSL